MKLAELWGADNGDGPFGTGSARIQTNRPGQ
jgi:hypothetical protein